MTTRTINGDIPLYPSSTVLFRNVDVIISGGDTYPPKTTTAAVDGTGAMAATALVVPDSDAATYIVRLPAGSNTHQPSITVSLEAGAALDLSVLIASALANPPDPDYVAQAIDAHNADTSVHGIADTSALATTAALTAHTGNVANPHAVTAAQAGAAPLRHITAQTLTDAASIAWDTSAGHLASVTLGGNRTLAAPTNGVAGTYILRVTQDGTGSRALAYNAAFKWAGGTAPTLSTTAGAVDILSFVSPDGATFYGGDALKAFA